MENTGIYEIRNLINNKIYIGSAIDFKKRWRVHKCQLLKNKHHSIKLQRAWNKYGSENFKFNIIEIVENKSFLIGREQYWIDNFNSYKNGYNSRPKAESQLGVIPSKETREKISKTLTGRVGPNKDKKMPQETKDKISKTKKGKPSNRKGSKHTEEQKTKWSKLRKGIKWNPNYTNHTKETIDKMKQFILENGQLGGNYKKCMVDGIEFKCAKDVAKHFNITYDITLCRLKSNKKYNTWYFIL